eukprot:gb/GEZN01020340.1/.p1 GENE.gb/GEZN01020340.1/~~gb/GEZN01020340.1/.p1  ORF type:complete len:187 (-),score=12.45 gb/GEZN01020340.1/:71-631(-)
MILQIPPIYPYNSPLAIAEVNPDFDYKVTRCHGDHQLGSCPSAAAARHETHRNINLVFFHAGREAGVETNYEPSSFKLLENSLSEEECLLLLPKQLSRTHKRINQLQLDLDQTVSLSRKSELTKQIKDLTSYLPTLTDSRKGARLDFSFYDRVTNQSILGDSACVHATCHSSVHILPEKEQSLPEQ